MLISVVNKSKSVSNAQLTTVCRAIQKQIDLHVNPAFNLQFGTITFASDISKIPGHSWIVNIIEDDTQVEGALGYHTNSGPDKVDGFIMCKPILDNGGAIMKFDPKNPGQYTISGTLSHEVIEMIGDRFTNTWYDFGQDTFCGELCDPVEQVGYGIEADGVNVAVSDFVFESFFNPLATLSLNAPFNYLNTVKAPFTMLAGGYMITRKNGVIGSDQQIFGESMPQWRRDCKQKSFARGGRRISIGQ